MILDTYNFKEINFIDCSGFVILETRAAELKQLENYVQPGKLIHFKIGDVLYIPEKIWQDCQGDIKIFNKKLLQQEREKLKKAEKNDKNKVMTTKTLPNKLL